MTLASTLSSRRLAARSLRWTSAGMILSLVSLAALPAAAQNQGWIVQLGTSGEDIAYAAAPDGSGGVYASGTTYGSLGGPNAGYVDAWVARYDSAGSQVWIRQFGTSEHDYAGAAAPDGAGGAYVGGSTTGSLGGPNAGGGDAWLARFDAAGNRLWRLQLGTTSHDGASAAATDGSGGVYVSGTTEGSLAAPNAGFRDAWLARYDAAGNQIWIRQLGSSGEDPPTSASPDGSGGVYLSGWTTGSLGGPFVGGYYDAWLAHYDSAGNQTWSRQLGTIDADFGAAAAPDGSGGVYVGGYTYGSLGAPNAGLNDAILARYDSAGNQLWVRQLGTSSFDSTLGAAPDGSGGVYVGGDTEGSLGGPSAGLDDTWLARYDNLGNQIWIRQFGTSGDERAYAAAADGSGGVHVGGWTNSNFGGLHKGDGDAWLARYDGCGVNSIYCTAKTNSAGCVPSIATSGTPSASAGSGFTIKTSNVLDNKFGKHYYSTTGANKAPFQGGFLCLEPPLVRTPVQNSGGASPCGGVYVIDFNAYIASGKDPSLVPGQQVWVQTWSRDPGFAPPNNTSLSDAVSFTLCP
jgi:catechol 2,3-dioxygenase-like lactoylglutathione lyase family enzyme